MQKIKTLTMLIIIISLLCGCRNSISGVDIDQITDNVAQNNQNYDPHISGCNENSQYNPHVSGA